MAAGNLPERSSLAALLAEASQAGVARLDAELLLARATGYTRVTLLANGDLPADADTALRYRDSLRRRSAGEPLAYIDGHREFWSLDFAVSPAVLVPRPETELLVERCLALLPAAPQRVADLGTGSGAIALALGYERPRWSIVATDVSVAALAVASGNATRLQITNVEFRRGNWWAPLAGELFDAVVSNPPYVAAGDPALQALQHEPIAALASADDGYADLLALVAAAPQHLRPGAVLLLEHGATQAPRLAAALVARGFARVVCHPDLAGLPRVTEAVWPESQP
ncbi:MAG TPA: peptide chain release factor N(5)-glutamine methyltransferase [Steroidobacteraceae bacterium]|jgi:release factor glutamine methyltransferase|nr:peptide chain release factor N(5)-glutamine methyltransferase [Steroidobacteraceae bacterium]